MTLFKTSVLSALAVVTRLLTSVFLNKVVAVYVGPTGYGLLGQFQTFVGILSTLASGGINTGVTRYTAELHDDEAGQRNIWNAASGIGLIGAGVGAVVLIIASAPLAQWMLGDRKYAHILIWLGCSLAFLVLNGLMLAILNGRKAVRSLVGANIAGSLISAALATALVSSQGLEGALLAIAVSQALACGVTAVIFQRSGGLRVRQMFGPIHRDVARRLGAFALMTATSALATPLAQLFIRDQLAANLGWSQTGLWQALWKISELHLMLLTTTLSVYLLPRFSEIRDPDELVREVRAGYRFVLPLSLATCMAIYLLRAPLVRGLLTAEFLPLVALLGLQLLGDFLKVNSWVVAYTMISHARTRLFMVTEICFAFAGWQFRPDGEDLGLLGAAGAYALTYGLYWVVVGVSFRSLVIGLRHERQPGGAGVSSKVSV